MLRVREHCQQLNTAQYRSDAAMHESRYTAALLAVSLLYSCSCNPMLPNPVAVDPNPREGIGYTSQPDQSQGPGQRGGCSQRKIGGNSCNHAVLVWSHDSSTRQESRCIANAAVSRKIDCDKGCHMSR